MENRSMENLPMENRSMENRSVDNRSVGTRSVETRPMEVFSFDGAGEVPLTRTQRLLNFLTTKTALLIYCGMVVLFLFALLVLVSRPTPGDGSSKRALEMRDVFTASYTGTLSDFTYSPFVAPNFRDADLGRTVPGFSTGVHDLTCDYCNASGKFASSTFQTLQVF